MLTLDFLITRTISYCKHLFKDISLTIITLILFSIAIVLCIKIVSGLGFAQLILELIRPIIRACSDNPDFSDLLTILLNATPLILAAFAFSLPFKAGFFNIGTDGVMIIASFAYLISYQLIENLHTNILLTLFIPVLVAIVAGGLWGSVPYLLKKYSSTDEVITGLFLNNIAMISIGYFLIITKLIDSSVSGTQSISFSEMFSIFSMYQLNGKCVTFFLPISLVFVFIVGLWLWFFKGGLHVRAVGTNAKAADILGLIPNRIVFKVVLIGSVCATLCAINETLAYGRLSVDAIRGVGFDGILVAILGGHRTSGIIIASVFWSLWRNYGNGLQMLQLPYETLLCAQAIFLIGYLLKQKFGKLERQFL